jgi:hypothetical protein
VVRPDITVGGSEPWDRIQVSLESTAVPGATLASEALTRHHGQLVQDHWLVADGALELVEAAADARLFSSRGRSWAVIVVIIDGCLVEFNVNETVTGDGANCAISGTTTERVDQVGRRILELCPPVAVSEEQTSVGRSAKSGLASCAALRAPGRRRWWSTPHRVE